MLLVGVNYELDLVQAVEPEVGTAGLLLGE